jgi:predicted lipoprotein
MGASEAARLNRRPALLLAAAAGAGALLYFFPLFHVVALTPTAPAGTPAVPSGFDPVATAAKFWRGDLPAAQSHAVELAQLAPAIRANAESARTQHAKAAGLGTAYYFVRGRAKVVARERNLLRLAPVGAGSEVITVRLGPVFGNTVRDGTGLLDVNAFPGLQEFNALSAELNALVEKSVLPLLRDQAAVGTVIELLGCAEAPESAPDAGEPLFTLVPVRATVGP